MKHKETCVSNIKPGYAFLLCLGVIIAAVLLSRALPIQQYQIFVQLFIILFVGALVYLLYRYTMTVHTYFLEDRTFSVFRGEGVRQKIIAVLTDDTVRLIARSTYSGTRIPQGDFIAVNACSSLNGKSRGYCIWCDLDSGDRYKLYIEPSGELVEKLKAAFPDHFADDAHAS